MPQGAINASFILSPDFLRVLQLLLFNSISIRLFLVFEELDIVCAVKMFKLSRLQYSPNMPGVAKYLSLDSEQITSLNSNADTAFFSMAA